MLKIAIGNDHRGFVLKEFLLKHRLVGTKQVEWLNVGSNSAERTDYPIFAIEAVKLMQAGSVHAAVLACGTGTGMAVVANRFANIYAGVAWNETIARLNKEDDNVNVLVLPADYMSNELALACIEGWLSAEFKAGRYAERIAMIDSLK